MIDCQQARNLFDAYLNAELSSSWTAELHAHAVSCGGCRRELSLVVACGDVIAKDRVGPEPSEDFTERVLSATAASRARLARWNRWRSLSVWGGAGATAAAAAIMLWFAPFGMSGDSRGVVLSSVIEEAPSQPMFDMAEVFPVRAIRATQRGAEAIGVLGRYGLTRFEHALGQGLWTGGSWADPWGGMEADVSVGALFDLLEILREHQQTEAESGLEVM